MSRENTIGAIYDRIHKVKTLKTALDKCKPLFYIPEHKQLLTTELITHVYNVISNNQEFTKEDIIDACMFGEIESITSIQTYITYTTSKEALKTLFEIYRKVRGSITIVPVAVWMITLNGISFSLEDVYHLSPLSIDNGRIKKVDLVDKPINNTDHYVSVKTQSRGLPQAVNIIWNKDKFDKMRKEKYNIYIMNDSFTSFRSFGVLNYFYTDIRGIQLECDVIYLHHITKEIILSGNIEHINIAGIYHNDRIHSLTDLLSLIEEIATSPSKLQDKQLINLINTDVSALVSARSSRNTIQKSMNRLEKEVHIPTTKKTKKYELTIRSNPINTKIRPICIHVSAYAALTVHAYTESIGVYLQEYTTENAGHYTCKYCGAYLPYLTDMLYDLINVEGKALFYSRLVTSTNIYKFPPYNDYVMSKGFVLNFIYVIDKQLGMNLLDAWMDIAKTYLDSLIYIKNNKNLLMREYTKQIKTSDLFFFVITNESFLLESSIKEQQLTKKRNNLYALLAVVYCMHITPINAEALMEKARIEERPKYKDILKIIIKRCITNKFVQVESSGSKVIDLLYNMIMIYANLRDQYILTKLTDNDKKYKVALEKYTFNETNYNRPLPDIPAGTPIDIKSINVISPVKNTVPVFIEVKRHEKQAKNRKDVYNPQSEEVLDKLIEKNLSLAIEYNNTKYLGYTLSDNSLYLFSGNNSVLIARSTLEEMPLTLIYTTSPLFNLLYFGEKIPMKQLVTIEDLNRKVSGLLYVNNVFKGDPKLNFGFTSPIDRKSLNRMLYITFSRSFNTNDLVKWCNTNSDRLQSHYKMYLDHYSIKV